MPDYTIGDSTHGLLEDVSSHIGYTATCNLVDWWGGSSLYVPNEPIPGHLIETVIGQKAFVRLVAFCDDLFGKGRMRVLNLPLDFRREVMRRDRMICALFLLGKGTKEISAIAMLSENQIKNIRRRLEECGLLPLILSDSAKQEGPP